MENQINEAQSKGQMVMDLLEQHDLFWEVRKEKLYTREGIESKHVSVRRTDIDTEFMACKDSYEIFQNWDLAELTHEISTKLGGDIKKEVCCKEDVKSLCRLIVVQLKILVRITTRLINT
jgi:hypothetical protein